MVTVDPSPGSNDEVPLPSRKSRSAELFGGEVATWTNPSELTDSGLACGVQFRPWVGLKSALLSMVALLRQMRASMAKIELLGASTWMWATCPSTTFVSPVAVTVTGMSPGGVSATTVSAARRRWP